MVDDGETIESTLSVLSSSKEQGVFFILNETDEEHPLRGVRIVSPGLEIVLNLEASPQSQTPRSQHRGSVPTIDS